MRSAFLLASVLLHGALFGGIWWFGKQPRPRRAQQVAVVHQNPVPQATPDRLVQANLACALFIGVYLLGRITVFRPPLARPFRTDLGEPGPRISDFALALMVVSSAFISLVSIPFIGAGMATLARDAVAAYDVNIPPPGSPIANDIYDLHMLILWVCLVIFVVVFGAMFYSLFKFRKSVGAKAEQWHENTTVEVIWTIIPFIILVGMAYPATKTILDMKDSSNPDITVKVTAYQWKWGYEYMQDGVSFYSQLATPRDQIEERNYGAKPKNPNYLLEVDNEMVVPVGKRVRVLVTSSDVIHGWYVPQLGVNQYGIPGFIKDAWFQLNRCRAAANAGLEGGFRF